MKVTVYDIVAWSIGAVLFVILAARVACDWRRVRRRLERERKDRAELSETKNKKESK